MVTGCVVTKFQEAKYWSYGETYYRKGNSFIKSIFYRKIKSSWKQVIVSPLG